MILFLKTRRSSVKVLLAGVPMKTHSTVTFATSGAILDFSQEYVHKLVVPFEIRSGTVSIP